MAGLVLLATEEMKAHLDQRDPKDHEESKEPQETEARWERGERTGPRGTEQKVAMDSRVTLAHVEIPASRAARELLDPKGTTGSLENQEQTTIFQGQQDQKGPKVTEDLRARRDLRGLQDHKEPTNVRFWISS